MTRADVYRQLARLYNYTPQQIAEMTREQQLILLTDSPKSETTMQFADFAAYQKWKAEGN